ncbi:trimethylamine methyltransferase family protein [Eubacterium sp. 1001713B170207_170306_E7]|uniref:trimethylamine methyltransferase family protein n=1 Tax=Eubacterium sp. 1001713B170207_170306_E7 TaxID=2787097 RepID=UPI001896C2F3|nr:trimethylamine methyltransferase family protein [Eubacterium sp. 1001713B170207_170306_E7]
MKSYERILSKTDIENIHALSLKILDAIGIQFEHPKALEILKANGCRVEGQRVFFDRSIIEETLKKIPASFELYTQAGPTVVGGGSMLMEPVSGNIYINDGKKIRRTTNDDTIDMFKLADTSDIITSNYLNYFSDENSMTEDERLFYQTAMMLKYSNKATLEIYPCPLGLPHDYDFEAMYCRSFELINRFYGNDTPHGIYLVNPLSPLCYDTDPLQKLMIMAKHGIPMMLAPCAMPMLTAPYSVYSMIAMTNAEVLAGAVLTQLIRPGHPMVFGNTSASTNLRTVQLSIGSPETALVSYALAGLADFYEVPFRTAGGLSDAKSCDAQAGLESMLMCMATLEIKPDYILHGCGTIGSFNVMSFDKFLMDEEAYRMAARFLRGIDTAEEKSCFDLLSEIGPRGNFLHGRTPKMFKEEFFSPKVLNKEDPNQWQNSGSRPLTETLSAERTKRIASYEPPKLSAEQERLVNQYIPHPYRETL